MIINLILFNLFLQNFTYFQITIIKIINYFFLQNKFIIIIIKMVYPFNYYNYLLYYLFNYLQLHNHHHNLLLLHLLQ